MQLDNITFNHAQLVAGLNALSVDLTRLTAAALTVTDITFDSREANLQRAFIAFKGSSNDGHDYIADAIKKGCKLVLCEKAPSQELLKVADLSGCSIVNVAHLKQRLANLLGCLFALSADVKITAVTGTNGKTSVASLYAQLALAQTAQSACLGTLGLNIYNAHGGEIALSNTQIGINTTPDIISHYKVLTMLAQQGISEYCLEASSHGIEQQRLAGLPINTAIFTNLTQDHLDYHGTLAAYALAKRGLLTIDSVQHVVLNADDAESQHWRANTPSDVSIAWYGLSASNMPKDASHYLLATELRYTPAGISFVLTSTWGEANIGSPLFGLFNVSNILAALCALLLQGHTFDALIQQIAKVKGVPGRMELFVNDSVNANMIVDYAHTPDALEQALKAARQHTSGKLICIFGCGGNRDKSKRPLMGAAASHFADVVVLTQDNSRNESPADIICDIQTGISDASSVHVELDRKTAIRWAWKNSTKDDLILVAGKGHEDYLEINNRRLPYSEREFVKQLGAEVTA